MPTLVTINCVVCCNEFVTTFKKRNQQTCSKDCAYKLRISTRQTQHEPTRKRCASCNQEFDDTSKKKLVKKCEICILKDGVAKRREKGTYARSPEQNHKLSETLKEKYSSGWNPNTFEHKEKLSRLLKARWKSGSMSESIKKTCQEKYGTDHWTKSTVGKKTLSALSKGRKFSDLARRNMSAAHARSILAGRKCYTSGKGGVRSDIGFYVRSRWEANFARICIYEKWQFKYEPCSFDLGNHKFYIPDFVIGDEFYELKGYMSDESGTRLDDFKKIYPNITLKIIGPKEYNQLKTKYKQLINWEE
jgi:hypothetical protein